MDIILAGAKKIPTPLLTTIIVQMLGGISSSCGDKLAAFLGLSRVASLGGSGAEVALEVDITSPGPQCLETSRGTPEVLFRLEALNKLLG